jgi:uncharacterized protein
MKNRNLSVALSLALGMAAITVLALALGSAPAAQATNAYQTLPFSENWGTDLTRISTDNNWSGVPGVEGYHGSMDLPANTDPRTVLTDTTDSGSLSVLANQVSMNPTVAALDGVFEFEIDGTPRVDLHASSTFDAPFLLVHINATGQQSITVEYDVIDNDALVYASTASIQQVALHYRVGDSGPFINVAAGYIADATGNSAETGKITHVEAVLPAGANGQAQVQFRIMTTNVDAADYNDEFITIDNISVTGSPSAPIDYDNFIYLPLIMR